MYDRTRVLCLGSQQAQAHLAEEDSQYHDDQRTGPPGAPLAEQPCAQVVAQDAEAACGEPQGEVGDSVPEEHGQGGDVGGQVDDLGDPSGGVEAHVGRAGEEEQEEGTGTRPVEAVVGPRQQGNGEGDGQGFTEREGGFFHLQAGTAQDVPGGERQHHQHGQGKPALRDQQGEPGPGGGTGQGKHHAEQGLPPGDKALPGVAEGGYGGAHGGAELVGADGGVDGDSGDQVGGQGDQPAASGDGVHKSGDAH